MPQANTQDSACDSRGHRGLGEICYRAFCTLADQHNFPHEFPAPGGCSRRRPQHDFRSRPLRNRRRAERTNRRQQLHGRALDDRRNRSDQRRSRRAEQRRRPRDDAAHARSRRRESTAGRPAGADRLSQSLAQPVREARLRNPRAAVRDGRIADQRIYRGLPGSRRHRRRPRRVQPAVRRRART